MKPSKIALLALALLAVPAALAADSRPAQATVGFSIQIGPGYGYYGPRYYRPYYYVPPPPVYYAPAPYPSYGGGRCDYYADACGRNWGWRNRNWYGCMRYHGCR